LGLVGVTAERVLVVNAGSSSLKLQLLDRHDQVVSQHAVERWTGESNDDPLRDFLAAAGDVDAVGHRVVHGGPRFSAAVRIDDSVVDYLASISDLAPLHQPKAVEAIRTLEAVLPGVPAVACFDTAFHSTMLAAASTYALPREWNERWNLQRYGFHGLSHAYAVRRGAELSDQSLESLRVVSCHLGAGASLAAVRSGRSIDTTMGFTPLAGLVMVTRSGSVDPGLLLWLLREGKVGLEELTEGLEKRGGLAGLSGTSGDLRDVFAARDNGDEGATLAYDVFLHRLCREIGAMTAAAGGLDLLVMTGGIGERSALVRRDAAERLDFLGVAVDPGKNEDATADADISGADATVRTVVVTAREDLEMARLVRSVLA
jgi:acetate kinase